MRARGALFKDDVEALTESRYKLREEFFKNEEPTGVRIVTGRRSVVMFPMLRKSSRLVVQVPPVLRKSSRLVVQVPHSTNHFVINVRLGHKNA
jgi:hypothetical protein